MSLSRITTWPAWSLQLSEINNIMYAVKTLYTKSHTRFRLVPKSTTLDELEGLLKHLKHMHLSEATTKTWTKIDPYYQRCSPMTVVFGKYKVLSLCGYSRGSLEWGLQTTGGLPRTAIFSKFSLYFFISFREGQHCYIPSNGVTLYCRVTLNKISNNDMFDSFHYYVQRFSKK